MTRKTTPEKPPSTAMLSKAGSGTRNPKALTPAQQRSIDARVLSEGNKRKSR
jgi:hypothetical protein